MSSSYIIIIRIIVNKYLQKEKLSSFKETKFSHCNYLCFGKVPKHESTKLWVYKRIWKIKFGMN
jgi:hypothetical protein